MRDAIIVALDTDTHTALTLARTLRGHVQWLKVGMTLYYAEGPDIIVRLQSMGFRIFLDLKLHDIPHQVEGAARQIARLGVAMFTVHASGGQMMLEAAVRGACEGSRECGIDTPNVLAVTVLTSMDAAMLASTGVMCSPRDQVGRLLSIARDAGVQGVVCSPHEAALARATIGPEGLVVTPGVRLRGGDPGDQKRVATPVEALRAGASHIVIGRPVTGAPNPVTVVHEMISSAES